MLVLSQHQTDRHADRQVELHRQTHSQMGKEANKKKHEQPQNPVDFSVLEARPAFSWNESSCSWQECLKQLGWLSLACAAPLLPGRQICLLLNMLCTDGVRVMEASVNGSSSSSSSWCE